MRLTVGLLNVMPQTHLDALKEMLVRHHHLRVAYQTTPQLTPTPITMTLLRVQVTHTR